MGSALSCGAAHLIAILTRMIRRMTQDDVEAIAAMMGRAYWDDPLQSWLFPDENTRLDRLTRGLPR